MDGELGQAREDVLAGSRLEEGADGLGNDRADVAGDRAVCYS